MQNTSVKFLVQHLNLPSTLPIDLFISDADRQHTSVLNHLRPQQDRGVRLEGWSKLGKLQGRAGSVARAVVRSWPQVGDQLISLSNPLYYSRKA